jgi:hypothetical protein
MKKLWEKKIFFWTNSFCDICLFWFLLSGSPQCEGVPFTIIPTETTPLSCFVYTSGAEPHHFYAAPAPGENFDVALVAPASTLLHTKAKFLEQTKVYTHAETILFIWFCTILIAENMNWLGYKL